MSRSWPRRPRLVAGNWKMHKTGAEGATLARELVEAMRAKPQVEIAICPPFTAIEPVREVLRGAAAIHLGAQNLHPEKQGAFTGEVSAPMLAAAGCRFVIVGHSERRHGMGEDDALVARKLRAALAADLTPIVCVGETLAERESNATALVLERQVRAAYDGIDRETARSTVVAYEPVWAIGTGKVATTEQARDAHRVIRATLERAVAAGVGEQVAILYGGSVNAGNAAALFAEAEIDGALVGGASLEAAQFWKIAVAAAAA
jgi:triosephosphate isomerase